MKSILADFFRAHHQHEAWWYKIKITPKVASHSTNDALLPQDEAPDEHCISKILGIPMLQLWEVLLECKLAKKRGQIHLIDKEQIKQFIRTNELTDCLFLGESNKVPVMRLGVSQSDHSAANQWKSGRKPPRPLRHEAKKFRDDMKKYFDNAATKKLVKKNTATGTSKPANKESSPTTPIQADSPPLRNLKMFLSKVLASPDVMQDPSFFKEMDDSLLHSMLQTCYETCDLERKKEKEQEEAVSAAVPIQNFNEQVNPKDYPVLSSYNIELTSDKDITPLLRDIVKLSKKVTSVDLLKVLHYNDTTTSLVEVPCSSKQSGFKRQARKTKWVHRILQSVRRYDKEDLLVGDENNNGNDDDDNDNNEIAYTDDDAARWLITYLGDYFPKEFVKSAQALDMPIHQGKMGAEYAAAMWSDASVGVAAQRIIMKYFIGHFGYKFTVPEAAINKLAIHSVPPVVCTIEYMDMTLDYWYKDLVGLLTSQIANEHAHQPADFCYKSVDFVIGADHGQGSFRAGVKVIYRNDDRSIRATAIYGLGEIECAKDTGELLALAFTPKLNSALKRIISYERDEEGNLVSDGTLGVYKKHRGAEGDAEGEAGETFYAILDRTDKLSIEDEMVLNVPIRVFMTGDLAFYATVVGKEGMDKAHCLWCKLKKAQWQQYGHERGVKWTLQELKRVAASLYESNKTENGVKSYPQLDCVELERYIFPVLHVTLGIANRLLKHTVDYADLVVERTPPVLKEARHTQLEAEHKHDEAKQEITDWGVRNGPTLANMHLAQSHLDEQIEVEGELSDEEREQAILDVASLKQEITNFKKELSVLKKKKTELSQANTAAKLAVVEVEKTEGRYPKPIRKGLEHILAKEWNIKRPSWHGGDILGNECRKLMSSARLIYDELKEFLLQRLEEDGASARRKREVRKRCDLIAKCLLLFDGFLSILRTEHKDLTPALIAKAREYARKALAVWRILKLSVTPKCHGSEDHACDQLEFLWGLADFCEDWVEQLHQLGLKNNRRTKVIRNRERKYELYTKWEQLSGNRSVQKIKKEVHLKRKRKLQNADRAADTEAATLEQKTFHREAALLQDNSQWEGDNMLLSPADIIRLDYEDDAAAQDNID
jgi:hypothetical protein